MKLIANATNSYLNTICLSFVTETRLKNAEEVIRRESWKRKYTMYFFSDGVRFGGDTTPLSNHFYTSNSIEAVIVEPKNKQNDTIKPKEEPEEETYVRINGAYTYQLNINTIMNKKKRKFCFPPLISAFKNCHKTHPDPHIREYRLRLQVFCTLAVISLFLAPYLVHLIFEYVQEYKDRYDDVELSNNAPKPQFNFVSFTSERSTIQSPLVCTCKEEDSIKKMMDKVKKYIDDEREQAFTEDFFTAVNKIETLPSIFKTDNDTVLHNNIFWGPEVENALPDGFAETAGESWERYVNESEIIKMEVGCGRMQNRLVTFKDGTKACVRYRQNTDQIQGEIFSYYLGKALNLSNLVPSVIKVVDLNDKLWASVASDIASAQWNINRAVVLTQYIPGLESASIPELFKPVTRHLNKFDVLTLSLEENSTISKSYDTTDSKIIHFDHLVMKLQNNTMVQLLELAQWADLIIFDYLTANLDRIVNNLFNHQWNENIMDGPAHNLAKNKESGLLVFLDNESGLLHGYRLLNKYNSYHELMIKNLCVFRKTTIDAIDSMYNLETVGSILDDMYEIKNDPVTRDVLPPLPNKNKKILHERLGHVLDQVKKCYHLYSTR